MRKGTTMKEMANRLNMSVSTVSKALNNDVSISDLTKERVHSLAKEWNYIPNESARHFKMKKSFSIGLIIPDLLDQFYVMAINGIEQVAKKEKYHIFITQSYEDVANEENIVNSMISYRMDGIIIAITKNTVDISYLNKLKSLGIPVVCMVREPQNHSFGYVCINNLDGAFKATNYLIKNGHRRIAHLMGPDTMPVSKIRLNGYKQALEKSNLPVDNALIKGIDFSRKQTEKAMRQLMELPAPPTGIFTFKNNITLDAISFLKKYYPHLLERVVFTDFGNLPLFEYLDHKPVASVKENFYEVGVQAAQMLLEMINSDSDKIEELYQKIEIPCQLIINK